MLEAKASILAAETQAVDHPQARSNHYDRSGVKLATRSRGEATTDLTVFSGFCCTFAHGRLLSQSVPRPLERRRSAENGLLISSCHADRAISADRPQRGTASFDIIDRL
jgi:hypothetical protein